MSDNSTDLSARLAAREAERTAARPAVWKPDPGEQIEGVVVETGTAKTQYADARPFFRVRTDAGTTWHVWLTAGLENELEGQPPLAQGERILVKFVGPEKTKTGRRYNRFLLVRATADSKKEEEK